jgi:hypothetical protein
VTRGVLWISPLHFELIEFIAPVQGLLYVGVAGGSGQLYDRRSWR